MKIDELDAEIARLREALHNIAHRGWGERLMRATAEAALQGCPVEEVMRAECDVRCSMGELKKQLDDHKKEMVRLVLATDPGLAPMPIGTLVDVECGDGIKVRSKTRSTPFVNNGGRWAVLVEGVQGGCELASVHLVSA